jgi:hypothetical protein
MGFSTVRFFHSVWKVDEPLEKPQLERPEVAQQDGSQARSLA